MHRGAPAPLANLLADNYKVPLTSFEQELGFAAGPSRGAAARRNLRPVPIPGTGARLGIATSLPAFEYGHAGARRTRAHDVAMTYMRCLSRLGANVLIQADANDGQWTGTDRRPSSGSRCPGWARPIARSATRRVRFTYAVNPFMVGNLADTPFDGQSAILQRGRRGRGCHYVGNRAFVPGQDLPVYRSYAGAKPQFLALAPWVVPDGRALACAPIGAALAGGTRRLSLRADRGDRRPPVPGRPRPARVAWWRADERGLAARGAGRRAPAPRPPALLADAGRGRAPRAGRPGERVDVVVVGAGLAGLTAATRPGRGRAFGRRARGPRPGRRPDAQPSGRPRRGGRGRRRVGRSRPGPDHGPRQVGSASGRSRPTPRAS